jgi:hypothetical protein
VSHHLWCYLVVYNYKYEVKSKVLSCNVRKYAYSKMGMQHVILRGAKGSEFVHDKGEAWLWIFIYVTYKIILLDLIYYLIYFYFILSPYISFFIWLKGKCNIYLFIWIFKNICLFQVHIFLLMTRKKLYSLLYLLELMNIIVNYFS